MEHKTASVEICDRIRDDIVSGALPFGSRLTLHRLASRYATGHMPVREALRQLESEGLIEIQPNRGPLVSRLTRRDAESLYEMRGALEALAARLFAVRGSDAQIAELERAVGVLQAAYKRRGIGKIVEAKRRFYEVLTEGSGNSMIGPALNTMYARINQLRRISLSSPRRAPQSMREIRAIVAAIKRRDAGAAYAASLHHVEQAAKAALGNLPE
jgi:DNA-binding GntR family transcriptional regulator